MVRETGGECPLWKDQSKLLKVRRTHKAGDVVSLAKGGEDYAAPGYNTSVLPGNFPKRSIGYPFTTESTRTVEAGEDFDQ